MYTEVCTTVVLCATKYQSRSEYVLFYLLNYLFLFLCFLWCKRSFFYTHVHLGVMLWMCIVSQNTLREQRNFADLEVNGSIYIACVPKFTFDTGVD